MHISLRAVILHRAFPFTISKLKQCNLLSPGLGHKVVTLPGDEKACLPIGLKQYKGRIEAGRIIINSRRIIIHNRELITNNNRFQKDSKI